VSICVGPGAWVWIDDLDDLPRAHQEHERKKGKEDLWSGGRQAGLSLGSWTQRGSYLLYAMEIAQSSLSPVDADTEDDLGDK
jgi:hypothetical protein